MKKTRSKGEGSIDRLPSGKWRARVTIRGGRLSHTADRKQDVIAWLRKTVEQADQGLTYKGATMTLAEYVDNWLRSLSVRPSTLSGYESAWRNHLSPSLGEIALKDLTADLIQETYDHLRASGIGAQTISKAHNVISQVLKRACLTGLLIRNPCDHVSKPQTPHREMNFWTEENAGNFLANASNDRFYALFYLALTTGMRQGELLGLQWIDLDWRTGALHVRRQLGRDRVLAQLKTKAGNRTIRLGAGTLGVLRLHFEKQQQERMIAGSRWQEYDLIFTTRIGTPINHKNLVDRHFKPLQVESGSPIIRFHDLRHTAAAILLSRGTPIFTVSKLLGHARPSITSDIYGHLIPGAADSLVETLEDLITPVGMNAFALSPIGHESVTGKNE